MQLEEYDAFWCFVSLMERQKYLRGYYSANMSRYVWLTFMFKV